MANHWKSEKRCPICKKILPRKEFLLKSGKTKMQNYCNPCKKIQRREYYLANRDRVLVTAKMKRANNKEYIRNYNKKYRADNLEYYRAYQRSDLYKEWHRQYNKTAKGQLSAFRRKSRRRDKGGEFTLTIEEWDAVIINQNYRCAGCATEFTENNKPEHDHVVPLSKGGASTISNIQALCKSCNRHKGAKVNWTYPYVQEWT
jgi:5-methylcytosine-specific restriction endonuclease McrA